MNRLASASLSLSLVMSLGAAACRDRPETSSAGDLGRVHFAYTTAGSGAGPGPLDKPLMIGAEEGTLLVEDDLPALFLRSTNPTAIEVTCKSSHAEDVIPAAEGCPIGPLAAGNSYDFTIKALAAGEAVIELWTTRTTTDRAALYDSIRVEARSATRVAVLIDGDVRDARGSAYDVSRGESFTVSRRAYAGDVELQASSGVTLCSTNPGTVSFGPSTFGSDEREACSPFSAAGARAMAPGSTSLTASRGSLSASAAVHVH